MIRLLGLNRIIMIVASILICAAVGAAWYYYLSPTIEQYDKDIKKINGQISVKQADIRQLKEEFTQLKDQILKYNLLKANGFFNAQDRVTARETTRELARQSKLLKAELNLSPGKIVDSQEARDAKHTLISGPMLIKLTAMDDVNAYKFVVALQHVFPGYLEFKRFDLHRSKDLDTGMLEAISKGQSDGLVDGEVEFNWWSMASQRQMEANPYFNPAAVATPTPQQ